MSTPIAQTVIQYSVSPDATHYWDLNELFQNEDIAPGEGYYSREVDIHIWVQQTRPRPIRKVPGYERVFTGTGQTAHFLAESASPNSRAAARCGGVPNGRGWRGTGSQEEIDALALKRDCKSCINLLKLDAAEVRRLEQMAALRAGRP